MCIKFCPIVCIIEPLLQTEKLIAAYPPVTEWKFDVYLNDLTDKTPLQTLLDR